MATLTVYFTTQDGTTFFIFFINFITKAQAKRVMLLASPTDPSQKQTLINLKTSLNLP